jgi:hypothetical protein
MAIFCRAVTNVTRALAKKLNISVALARNYECLLPTSFIGNNEMYDNLSDTKKIEIMSKFIKEYNKSKDIVSIEVPLYTEDTQTWDKKSFLLTSLGEESGALFLSKFTNKEDFLSWKEKVKKINPKISEQCKLSADVYLFSLYTADALENIYAGEEDALNKSIDLALEKLNTYRKIKPYTSKELEGINAINILLNEGDTENKETKAEKKATTEEEIPTTKDSAKSLATINVDDTTSTAIQAEVEQYKKQQEEQKKKDKELREKAKKVLKDLDLGFESIEHLTVSNETDFTTISYLLSSVQIQDATNYIARLFNDKLNSFIEDAIELNNQKLQEAINNKDKQLINKYYRYQKQLKDTESSKSKALALSLLKKEGRDIVTEIKQEIEDSFKYADETNKHLWKVVNDYYYNFLKYAAPQIEFFNDIKISFTENNGAITPIIENSKEEEDTEDSEFGDNEEDRGVAGNEGWSTKLKFQDPHKTLSKEIRKILYNIVKLNGEEADIDDFGNIRYLPYNQAYATLCDIISKELIDPEDFMQRDDEGNITYPLLTKAAVKYDWINQILDELDNNENLGSLFYSNFNKYQVKYVINQGQKIININDSTAEETIINNVTSNYEHGIILNKETSIYNSNRTLNKENLSKISQLLYEIDQNILTIFEDSTEEEQNEVAEKIQSVINGLGINFTKQDVLNTFFNFDSVEEGINNFNEFKSLVDKIITKTLQNLDEHFVDANKNNLKKLSNIIEVFNNLSQVSNFRQNGNSYSSYAPPSYLSNMIKHLSSPTKIKEYVEKEFKPYNFFYNSKTGKFRNGWLEMLISNPLIQEQMEVTEMKFVRDSDTNELVEYNKWKPKQIEYNFLSMFFNATNDERSDLTFANYHFPIFSDSEMAMFIRMPRFVGANYKQQLLPLYRDLVLQEMQRIALVRNRKKAGVAKIQNFDKRGDKFLFIPELNGHAKELEQAKIDGGIEGFNNKLDEILTDILNKKVQDFLKDFSYQEIKSIFTIPEGIEGNSIKENEFIKDQIENYIWNSTYAESQIIQLTATDLAFYKNQTDFQKRFKEVYASGTRLNPLSKYGKKTFKTIYLADNILTSYSYTLYEDSLKKAVKEKRITEAEKNNILIKLTSINATDAQGYRTLESYRSFLDMQGLWTDALEEAYNNLKTGKWTYNNFFAIYNTIKPFAYTQINSNDGVGGRMKVGHQIKDSESVLLSLFSAMNHGNKKGSAVLEGLQQFLETYHFDTAIFESGVKAGGQGIININYSSKKVAQILNANNKQLMKEAFELVSKDYDSAEKANKAFAEMSNYDKLTTLLNYKLKNKLITFGKYKDYMLKIQPSKQEVINTLEKYALNKVYDSDEIKEENGISFNTSVVHEIPTEDYMIAQVNTEHLFDANATHGSQTRTIMPADMPDDIEIEVQGKKLNKKQISTLFQGLQIQDLLEDFKSIVNDFSSIEKVQKLLLSGIEGNPKFGNSLKEALQIITDKNGNKQFNLPLNNPTTLRQIQELILSVFGNRITKQKVLKGGACTLVSSFGYTNDLHVIEDEKSNLQFEVYMPWHSQRTLAPFLTPIFKKGKIIGQKIDIEKVKENDPKLLEGFGYRIPTESKYSAMSFIIKGFLPQENGNTIMLPADTTLLAGEDFDIDKKFLMLYNFFFNEKTKKYETYKYDFSKSPEENSRESRQNLVLDIYRGIWGNVKVRDQVFSPGNYDTLKKTGYEQKILNSSELIASWQKYKKVTSAQEIEESLSKASLKELKKFLDEYEIQADPLSLKTFEYYHNQNMVGAANIGIYANNTSNQAKRQGLKFIINTNEDFNIKWNNNEYSSLSDIQEKGGNNRITKNCAEFNAASVDNVKDPVLALLNQYPDVAFVACTMLDLGFDIKSIGAFFNIPAISNYIKENQSLPSLKFNETAILNLLTDWALSLRDSIQARGVEISKDFKDKVEKAISTGLKDKSISITKDLNIAIADFTLKKNNLSEQELIDFVMRFAYPMLMFNNITKVGESVKTLTQIARGDSPNGRVKNSFGESLNQIQNIAAYELQENNTDSIFYNSLDAIKQLVGSPEGRKGLLDNKKELNNDDDVNSYVQLLQNSLNSVFEDIDNPKGKQLLAGDRVFTATQLGITEAPNLIFNSLFQEDLSTLPKLLQNTIFANATNCNVSPAIINEVIKQYLVYKLSGTRLLGNDDTHTYQEKRDYYLYTFPLKFLKMQISDKYKDIFALPILNKLTVINGQIVFKNSGRMTDILRNQLEQNFTSLLYMNDESRQLALDLFKYSYYLDGLQFTPNSYNQFFTTEFFKAIPEYEETLRKTTNMEDMNFINQFYLNNLKSLPLTRIIITKKNYLDSNGNKIMIPLLKKTIKQSLTKKVKDSSPKDFLLIGEKNPRGTISYNYYVTTNKLIDLNNGKYAYEYVKIPSYERTKLNDNEIIYYNKNATGREILDYTPNRDKENLFNATSTSEFKNMIRQNEKEEAIIDDNFDTEQALYDEDAMSAIASMDQAFIDFAEAYEEAEEASKEVKEKYNSKENLDKEGLNPCVKSD